MTNLELEMRFKEIEDSSLTIFDIYEELATLQKEYNDMPISKIIRSVYEAYETYHKHKDIVEKLTTAISYMDFSNIVDSFDLTKLTDQIPQDYQKILAQIGAGSE